MSQYKIWFQGATDRQFMAPYIAKVEAHFKSILDPEFGYTFNTTTPPATTTHSLTEYRVGYNFIRNAVEAERQGYHAVAVTHFQDPGLADRCGSEEHERACARLQRARRALTEAKRAPRKAASAPARERGTRIHAFQVGGLSC